MNTWLSFLYHNRELDEYPFLKGMPVDEENIQAHSCILFHSCSDVCKTPNCMICLASYVLEHQSEIGLKVGYCDLLHKIELGAEGGDVLERIALQLGKTCFQAAEAESCMCQTADDSIPGEVFPWTCCLRGLQCPQSHHLTCHLSRRLLQPVAAP